MTPTEVFLSYSHKDEKLRQELVKHLNILKHQGLIADWHDRKILPGDEWKDVLDDHLNSAKIILLLVSADFVSSEYCYNVEMKRAMERHRNGDARVIPIILRDVDWKGAPFGSLQALPTDGRPITSPHWKNRDEALTTVARGIRSVIDTMDKRISATGQNRVISGRSSKPAVGRTKGRTLRPQRKPAERGRPQFAKDVGSLYRLLGFKVDEDHPITAKANVIICEQTVRGGPIARLYVQCLDQRKRVSAAVCRQFVADLKSIPEDKGITGGVLVTRIAPTPGIRNTVNSPKCRILGFSELFDELLNVNAILSSYSAWYERQEIYLSYLPLRCTRRGEEFSTESVKPDLVRDIYQWLNNSDQLFVILGDFGTGKTTIAQRLKYELANKYLTGTSALVPIYIPLRNYESVGSLEKFVEAQLQNELDIHVPFKKFLEFVTQGRLLLLLDGFDEMGQQVDKERRRANFEQLVPLLLASPKNVLTCRPAYFLTDEELDSVFESISQFSFPIKRQNLTSATRKGHDAFLSAVERWNTADTGSFHSFAGIQSVQICELTERDVDRYVVNFNRRVGAEDDISIKSLRERIRQTYDLEDLARRPVLLNMIVQTVPLLPVDKEASPSVIYGAYTSTWMNHEYAKGQVRMLVPAAEKRGFMQTLAWQMYVDGVVQMHYSKLTPHLSQFFKAKNRMADFIATDIQACSFLERDQDGKFRFSHKSFLEYFAAEHLRACFERREYENLRMFALADAVCFFLGDMVHADAALLEQFRRQLQLMLDQNITRKDNLTLRDNLIRIFSKARTKIAGLRARQTTFENIGFRGNGFSGEFIKPVWRDVVFENCSFSDLRVWDLSAANVQLSNCRSNNVVLSNINRSRASSLDQLGIQINNCTMDQVTFEGAASTLISESSLISVSVRPVEGRMRINSCRVEGSDIEQSLKDFVMAHTKLTRCNLSGAPTLADNTYHFLDVIRRRWKTSRDKPPKWNHLTFNHCLITWWDFSQTEIIDCDFYSCWFLACRFRDIQQMQAFLGSKNAVRCKFALLCLREIEQEKDDPKPFRSHNALLRLLEGLSPQASNKIGPDWLRNIKFYKDPVQASLVNRDARILSAGLMVPHTIEDLL